MALLQKLALCGFLAGLATSYTAAYDVGALDKAILQDILESYTEHVPSKCPGEAASSTSFTYEFPGTKNESNWHQEFQQYEQDLFLAAMSHTDANNRSWTIRFGQGGNIYSHFCPDLHGETIPPQDHVNQPWVDEVHQSVSVNNNLNQKANMCNGDTCPAYYIHGAGTKQADDPYTVTPFYSQSLAKHCEGASCTFAAWAQQAHVETNIFTSPIITLNRFTNCGNGVIEHTEMLYNFAPVDSSPTLTDQNYFNVPWSGVRPSNLPFTLEPSNGDLSYDNPDTVDYCPLCGWGGGDHDVPGGAQGRCARANLDKLGGYTTFVANGLYMRSQKPYVWCSRPGGCNSTNEATCMAGPDECYDANGIPKTGYTPVTFEVPPNSTPDCVFRNPYADGQELMCNMRNASLSFGQTGSLTAAEVSKCAPWGWKMGFYRDDNNEGFEVSRVKHWSWRSNDQRIYIRVEAPNATAAINIVHGVMNNPSNQPLPIRFQVTPPVTANNGIRSDSVPPGYNPGALPAVTFVAGDGMSARTPGFFRRRLGSSQRDFNVYTVNYYGATVEAGYALSKRAFVFASELASVNETAESLKSNVVYDFIEETRYNPRVINIYKSGPFFDAVAATSVQGTSTTCTSPSADLECSGFSTPKQGYSPFFYVTCGNSSYLGPDPYFFTPGNGDWFTFPGMSNNNTLKIRSYACEGQDDPSVRPTWKLIGFFNSTCVSLGSGVNVTYDDDICVVPTDVPSSQPSSSSQPSTPPSSGPSLHPSSQPSSPPSSGPSLQPSVHASSKPSSPPSSGPSLQPSSSLQPSVHPTAQEKKYVWCIKPGYTPECNSGNEATCMAGPGECYNFDGYGGLKPGYKPMTLIVNANSHPDCRDRYQYSYNGESEWELMCNLHTTGFGRTKPYLRPPSGHTMGFYRDDNDDGFEVTYVKHFSWRSHDQRMWIRVKANSFREARDLVHGKFDNVGSDQPLSIRFEVKPIGVFE